MFRFSSDNSCKTQRKQKVKRQVIWESLFICHAPLSLSHQAFLSSYTLVRDVLKEVRERLC